MRSKFCLLSLYQRESRNNSNLITLDPPNSILEEPFRRKSIDNPPYLPNLRSNRIKGNLNSFHSSLKKTKGRSNWRQQSINNPLAIDPPCPNSFSEPPSFNPPIKEAYVLLLPVSFHSYIHIYLSILSFQPFSPFPSPATSASAPLFFVHPCPSSN